MKKILVAAFSALALTSCGGGASAAAVGTYELDRESLKAAMLALMPENMQKDPAAAEQIDAAAEAMSATIELKADGTATKVNKGMGQNSSGSGTWKLDGNKLAITVKDKSGKEETNTADYTNGSFTLTMGAEGPRGIRMVFRRK